MALPETPLTRAEEYLNNIATGEGTIPDEPLTRIEQYLDYIAKNGSGSVDPEDIASTVTNWLEENVDPVGSAVVVDSSLSVSGAAADAKKAGDYIRRLNSVNFVESKNIFDAEFVNGRISGGAFTPLSTGVSHIAEEEYIPVDGGEKYTLSFIAGKSYINLYISGYDASKTLIENAFSSVFVGVKETAFSTLLNVPAGCSYVRFSAYRDQEPYENMIPTNIQLEKGTVATEYESPDGGGAIIPQLQEELDDVKGNVSVQSVNMLDVVFSNSRVITGGAYQILSTGTTHASHAELIEVEPSAQYVMSWIPTELMIHCYVYEYNSNNGYLTYTHFSTNRDTPARAENSFTVGSTTKYIRLDFYRENVAWQELIPEDLQLQVGHTATDYEEPGEIFAIPVLEKKVAELDGGYLPNYYDAYLPAKIDQIKALLKSSVVNGDAFYFITDMHWDKNAQNSPAIIKRMNKELRIDKLFTGGDITSNGYADEPTNKLMDAMGGKNLVYGINGNHEFLEDATYADIFYMQSAVLPDSVVFGNREKNYYYFDNHKQQIRYIVLAAFGEAVNGAAVSLYTDADQLSWLTNTALDVDSGWTIIILTHSYYSTLYNGGAWGGAIQESPPQTDHGFTNAIKDYVQNGNGEIACIIIGHLHYDRIFEIEGMPKVVAVTCDKYAPWIENGTDREPWLAERVPGTVTEQAFDVVILDKTARTVKFVRVGGNAYDGINGSFGNAVQIRTISY